MRRPELESWEQLISDELAAWDSAEAAGSDDALDELLASCEVYEELHCGERELDLHRWELDPASAEDFADRTRGWRAGPSQRWRHFGH